MWSRHVIKEQMRFSLLLTVVNTTDDFVLDLAVLNMDLSIFSYGCKMRFQIRKPLVFQVCFLYQLSCQIRLYTQVFSDCLCFVMYILQNFFQIDAGSYVIKQCVTVRFLTYIVCFTCYFLQLIQFFRTISILTVFLDSCIAVTS